MPSTPLDPELPDHSDELARLFVANLLASGIERVYFKDLDSRFLAVSRGWLESSAPGLTLRDVVGRTDADIFSAEHAAAALADERLIIETGEPVVGKVERETYPDRPDTWALTTKTAIWDRDGRIVGTFGISRDVTAEHRAAARQAALAAVGESIARAGSRADVYASLLRGVDELAADEVSRAMLVVSGRLTPSIVASTTEPVRHPAPVSVAAAVLAERSHVAGTPPAVRRDGVVVVPIAALDQWSGALVLDPDRPISDQLEADLCWLVETVAVLIDNVVAARRLRSILRLASDAFAIVRIDGTIRYHAPSVERAFGFRAEDAIGRSLVDFVHPEDAPALLAAIQASSGRVGAPVSARWRRADGEWRETETTVADLRDDPEIEGIGLAIRDVTERNKLEVELRHAQKLEAIGQLAGGVAHEINTPVQFIGDNLEFLEESFGKVLATLDALPADGGAPGSAGTGPSAARARPGPGPTGTAVRAAARAPVDASELAFLRDEVPQALAQALDGCRRVAKIVHALKAFGYPDRGQRLPTDLNESLRNTLIVARGEVKYVADVVEDLGEIPLVHVVPGDVGQVFLNLIVNAAHAIGERLEGSGGRGTIVVTTRAEAGQVVVRIADDGAGIPDEVAGRVFEPFFTTKDIGKGTGQGLALARSVVDSHGGTISFRSARGIGTTFEIRLPVEPTHAATAPGGRAATEGAGDAVR